MKWKQAMQILTPAIDRKSCLPILQNIRITPDFVEATDLEYSIRITLGLAIMGSTKEGFTTPFEEVKSLVNPEFFYGDEEILVIDGGSKQKIGFTSWEGYPMLPCDQKSEKWITLPLTDLVDALSATIPHINPREPRTIVTAVNFRIAEGELNICGTDKRSLGVWWQKTEAEDADFSILNPAKLLKSLKAIQKAFPGFEEVYIGLPEADKDGCYGNVSFTFSSAPVAILVLLAAGKYPEVDQAIPQNWDAEIEVELKPLLAEMKKRHSAFCRLREPILFAEIADRKLRISMGEEGLKFEREFCLLKSPAKSGYTLKIAYDPPHFERCLSSLKGSTVGMRFLDKHNPTVLYAEEERFFCVLMPLRLKDEVEEEMVYNKDENCWEETEEIDEDNIPF